MEITFNENEIHEAVRRFLEDKEKARIREACFIDAGLAARIQETLSREAYLWDKWVSWRLYQHNNLGNLRLSIRERDPIGASMSITGIPGASGRHLFYGDHFSLHQNQYFERKAAEETKFLKHVPEPLDFLHYCFHDHERDGFLQSLDKQNIQVGLPEVCKEWAFVKCPSMIMDPMALLEIHTTMSEEYNTVVIQGYHPENAQIREEQSAKGRALAADWGLPQLVSAAQLASKNEQALREYSSALILREYASFCSEET